MKIVFIIIIIFLYSNIANSQVGEETGLKIPRYVSLKSNDANLRVGPSVNYPIVIKFIKKNYPLKIIEEHDEWRKIQDFKKNSGWIHKSLISGIRNGVIISDSTEGATAYNTINGRVIGNIGNGNIVKINKCKSDWCLISFEDNYSGWVNKLNLWGVEPKEEYKINYFQKFEDIYWQSINYLNSLLKEN